MGKCEFLREEMWDFLTEVSTRSQAEIHGIVAPFSKLHRNSRSDK
jgi:hypothetical protein